MKNIGMRGSPAFMQAGALDPAFDTDLQVPRYPDRSV
jgi:hypothetical protein